MKILRWLEDVLREFYQAEMIDPSEDGYKPIDVENPVLVVNMNSHSAEWISDMVNLSEGEAIVGTLEDLHDYFYEGIQDADGNPDSKDMEDISLFLVNQAEDLLAADMYDNEMLQTYDDSIDEELR